MFSNKSVIPALGLEKDYGEKIDTCITNTLLKLGAGLVTGGFFSIVLLKRRAWPWTLGAGVGLGMAYRDCEKNLRQHYIKEEEKPTSLIQNTETVEKIQVPSLEANIQEDQTSELEKGFEEIKKNSEFFLSSDQEQSQTVDNASEPTNEKELESSK